MFVYKRKIYGYLCDIYGHLNNSSYLQIYEEARSEALIDMGLPISKLLESGFHIYLTKVELYYKSGVPNDEIISVKSSIIKMNRMRATWKQQIYDESGNLCNEAFVEGVFIKNGKPARIDKDIYEIFEKYYEN
jgi:YbgC/YbaW family acyl-CoA thioester hydrolase